MVRVKGVEREFMVFGAQLRGRCTMVTVLRMRKPLARCFLKAYCTALQQTQSFRDGPWTLLCHRATPQHHDLRPDCVQGPSKTKRFQ